MPADRMQAPALAARALVLAAALCLGPAQAAQPPALAPTVAADPRLERDVMELAHKLRCLVCQNQSIAESNAPLALDLRNQVREQLQAGRSKDEVVDYLVARYGDFVLYEPPLKASTVLLWAGPGLLLVAGAAWLAWRLRRRAVETKAVAALSASERARARRLLGVERTEERPASSSEESRS